MNTRNLRFKSNRVSDIIACFREELRPIYGDGEVEVFLSMLFEAFLGWDKVRLLTSKEQPINQSDLLRFHWALEDLLRHRPIQHIIGYTDFCGCHIEVNPDVLIPRPETGEMVQKIAQHGACTSILDLCTGSGCIAIALKRAFPQAQVVGLDLSSRALATAQRNAKTNDLDVRWIQADVLDLADLIGRGFSPDSPTATYEPLGDLGSLRSSFDLIVSNPPYICQSERQTMSRNVLDYEPAEALFVPDNDPLLFYRAVGHIAKHLLSTDGILAVEINEAFAEEVASLWRSFDFLPTVHTDFRGKPRWIEAQRGQD